MNSRPHSLGFKRFLAKALPESTDSTQMISEDRDR
jgi:hypothetical protein